jgi:hypothetical protein
VNCVYCGHRYGPAVCPKCDGSGIEEYRADHTTDKVCIVCNGTGAGVPVAMADVLKEHIAQCPKHPLSEMKDAMRQVLELSLYGLRNTDDTGRNAPTKDDVFLEIKDVAMRVL